MGGEPRSPQKATDLVRHIIRLSNGIDRGTRLGPDQIEEMIGAGGMGEVYRARDHRLERMVAVKVLGDASGDPEFRERFRREARALSRLSHPNVAPCTMSAPRTPGTTS